MAKKLNILFLSWRGPGHPNYGGAEIVAHEHQKAWVKAGHKVTLFTSSYSHSKPEELIDGVKVVRNGDQYFTVKLYAMIYYLFGTKEVFDLVVDEFHGIPFFTPLYVRQKKLAFIHEIAKEVWKLNPWPFPLNLIPGYFGKYVEFTIFYLYKSIVFVTVSNSTKVELNKVGIKQIKVINNGVLLPVKIRKYKKEARPTLINLSAMARDKGTEDVVEMFAKIIKIEPKCRLWFVGRAGPIFLEKIKKLTKILKIPTKSVKFWGFVSETKKFELLSRAHLQVNASYCEGWGLVNIEANGSGIPVIGYDVNGVRDSVKHGVTGLLCPFGRHDLLADNALKLLNHPVLYKKMAKNAKIWSRKFAWDISARKSCKLISSL